MKKMLAGERFFVDIAQGTVKRFRIMGYYPNGNLSEQAVPRRPVGMTPWLGTFDFVKEAGDWAAYLNQADVAGQIDWNIPVDNVYPRAPKIKD